MRLIVDPAGFIQCNDRRWPAVLGRGGIRADKREGDGATPAGTWAMGRVFYRADRIGAPVTGLTTVATQPNWGWCDDPADPAYNTLITLPHPARHEVMWRNDGVYDVVVELHYNTDPVRPDAGSAIFMHVMRPDRSPTEGCIALELKDLLDLLRLCTDGDAVTIPGPGPAGPRV